MRAVPFGLLVFSLSVATGPSITGAATTPPKPSSGFALKDGDTVAFLGDSITAGLIYGKIIENYTILRYPDRRIRFFNAGWGGDTAEGGLKRLKRDVIDRGATVLTVAYGINDIGWGMRADEEHKQRYLKAIRGIVETCKAHHIRVYICSPAPTAADPFKSEGDFLAKMTSEGMEISRSLDEGSIDVLGAMRGIQKTFWKSNEATTDTKKRVTLHAEDTVHLNEYGQMAMAFAILKGLGAPDEVSSATVSAKDPKAIVARGCKISDVVTSPTGVRFVRLDQGLPLTQGLIGHVCYWYIPFPDQLARYMLTVNDLSPGKYEVRAEGLVVGAYTAKQLTEGVNIGNATPDAWVPGGPWDAQSTALKSLTDGRYSILTGQRDRGLFYPRHPKADQLTREGKDINTQVEKLQRDTARPVPYLFVVNRVAEK